MRRRGLSKTSTHASRPHSQSISHPTHDRKNEESRFVYGNATALALFECTWDELVGTLSTQSAEPDSEVRWG